MGREQIYRIPARWFAATRFFFQQIEKREQSQTAAGPRQEVAPGSGDFTMRRGGQAREGSGIHGGSALASSIEEQKFVGVQEGVAKIGDRRGMGCGPAPRSIGGLLR
jgi:hypothetical protein